MKKNLVKIVAFVLLAVMTVGLSSYYSGTSVRAETAASEQDAEGKESILPHLCLMRQKESIT
jgi:hypothetical protein